MKKKINQNNYFRPVYQVKHHEVSLVAGSVQAGFATWAQDEVDKPLSLDDYLIEHAATTFLVRVQGESMLEAGIMPGDILVVDKSLSAKSGQIVIAVVDNDLTVKRLVIDDQGTRLCPENRHFPSVVIPEGAQVSIWGVVVGVVRKLR